MINVATVAIAAAVVLMLILLLQLGLPVADEEEDGEEEDGALAPPPGIEARVERYIGLLNYGDEDTAAEASRSLLSMGPNILPVLLRHLNRLEERPTALSAPCQLRLEELMVAFGLVTYLACAEHLRGVHRGSPVFPAMMRIFVGIGPNLLVEIARNPMLDTAAALGPLLHRTGPAALKPLTELLQARPDAVPDALILATLPIFAAHPAALHHLLTALPRAGAERLTALIAPWGDPTVLSFMNASAPREVPEPLEELWVSALAWRAARQSDAAALVALAERWCAGDLPDDPWTRYARSLALDAAPLAEVLARGGALGVLPDALPPLEDAANPGRAAIEWALASLERDDVASQRLAVRLLGASLADPRAVERLIALAANPLSTWGWLALAELAREDRAPLEELLVARLRASAAGPCDIFHGRLALLRCPQLQVPLYRMLRAEAAQPVMSAAQLLASTEVSAEGLLKALGRHRYSPLEVEVMPLLWAQLARLQPRLVACLQDADREVRQGAVDVLGGYGDASAVEALLARLTPEAESTDSVINAVELIGPAAAEGLAAFIARRPEAASGLLLARRLELLRHAAHGRPAER